uniref:Uncharacterized protein n=1 Tax=Magallana gigas TaxID=29159 RepID=K1RWJ1_MAGGI
MASADTMFLCLFFMEDRSLSVLQKNDKNLSIDEFKEGSNCTMKWMGRKEYRCKIVKIHDNKEYLDKWATKVNNNILKRHAESKDLDIGTLVDEIREFREASSSGKRKRIETARSKESKIQDREISPKKKKLVKNQNEEHSPQKKTDLKEKEEVDKTKEKKNTKEKEKTSPKKTENRKEKKDEQNERSTTAKKKSGDNVERKKQTKEQVKKKAEASAAVNMSMEIVSMASQFSIETDITAPTSTQKEQEKGEMNLEKSPTKSAFPVSGTKSPLKPAAVTIDIHDNDLTRESSAYLMDLNNHSTPLTETWGLCQRSEEAGFGVQYSTETDNFQVSATNKVSMPVPSPHVLNTMRGIMHPEFQTYVREILNQFGHDSQDQNYSFQQHISKKISKVYEVINTKTNRKEKCTKEIIASYFVRVTPQTSKMTVQSSVPKNNNKEGERISSCAKGTAPSSISHNANTYENRTVKLLESSSIEVDKANLKKASSLAKKHSNPGYALCLKVIPLLFTDEELALSRGQGLIKAKHGDMRPCLNKEKVQVMKDYVQSWCSKNGFSVPSHAKLNDGVTERIAYSRKLLKKKSSN